MAGLCYLCGRPVLKSNRLVVTPDVRLSMALFGADVYERGVVMHHGCFYSGIGWYRITTKGQRRLKRILGEE